ncbi:PREDICTED: uncharacterized protein LOC106891914 [Calidris pugnax]|uniref:uncharacterized protein LOC106891914 n=1 Tax=Calidris pugnax TaxID=198806 RepID=UPI00071CE0F8|nr:PREDICTED: uncharacterized protein LOC106891914 [Calidris pugnax]
MFRCSPPRPSPPCLVPVSPSTVPVASVRVPVPPRSAVPGAGSGCRCPPPPPHPVPLPPSTASDFYVEMKWEFTSWVPLVSKVCPSDVYRVWKRGESLRVDTTLLGFEHMTWQRGRRSYIFKGEEEGAVVMEVDHDKQVVYTETLALALHEPDLLLAAMQPSEEHVAGRLTSPIVSTHLDTRNIAFERNKSGIWGWRSEKMEMVSGYEAKVYSASNVELVTKTRTEHLSDQDKSRSKGSKTPFHSFLGIAQQHGTHNGAPVLQAASPTNPTAITPEEYFDPHFDLETRNIGRPIEMSSKVQRFKATLWLCEQHPLSLAEQVTPIIDLMAISNAHFAKLRDFITLKLPPGFPVKIEIPLFHVLNARITFSNLCGCDQPLGSVRVCAPTPGTQPPNPRGWPFPCEVEAGVFEVPAGYTVLGAGRSEPLRDEDDDLLQFAIQQSLLDAGTETDQVGPPLPQKKPLPPWPRPPWAQATQSFVMVKGAALLLPAEELLEAEPPPAEPPGQAPGRQEQHLQLMMQLLRPQDAIRLAVRLESARPRRVRYLLVVRPEEGGAEGETALLGVDFAHEGATRCTLGMVLPLWSDTQVFLDGDGGFSVTSGGQTRIFKPISVQTMWPAVPELSEQSVRALLREVMATADLESVTSKEVREELERRTGHSLAQHKDFIDNEMLLVLAQMDRPSRVFPHLYLGSEWNAANLEELQQNRVTHILNVAREIDNFFPALFTYMNVRVYDEETAQLLPHWNDTFLFLSRVRAAGGRALVHCRMGLSRSAATVLAYAMKEYGWSLERALRHVRHCRPSVLPNPGFMRQLDFYQGILHASRHSRLWEPKATEGAAQPQERPEATRGEEGGLSPSSPSSPQSPSGPGLLGTSRRPRISLCAVMRSISQMESPEPLEVLGEPFDEEVRTMEEEPAVLSSQGVSGGQQAPVAGPRCPRGRDPAASQLQ